MTRHILPASAKAIPLAASLCFTILTGCGDTDASSSPHEAPIQADSDEQDDIFHSSSSFLEPDPESSEEFEEESSSSETYIYEWNWDLPKESWQNTSTNYNEMTDSRDGKKYKTTTIGIQTWMAENLNYYNAENNTLKGHSWCYENVNANCDVTGRLYTWTASVGKTEKECGDTEECDLGSGNVQGVCPPGWHLPKYEEWERLISYFSEDKTNNRLRTQLGWNNDVSSFDYRNYNGSDSYGFSALPAGHRDYKGDFYGAGFYAGFWSAQYTTSFSFSGGDRPEAYYFYLFIDDDIMTTSSDLLISDSRAEGYSVRCLQDYGSVDSVGEADLYSWSWIISKEARLNPDIDYDEMIDSRDGKKYKIVTIGTQIWMAENLNYYDESLKWNSWCYEDEPALCDVVGRLYTWAAATKSSEETCGYDETCYLNDGIVQGICPPGWHLPSQEEWDTLLTNTNARSSTNSVLNSRTGWDGGKNGTDSYGFTLLPAGFKDLDHFGLAGSHTYFWSATEKDDYQAYSMYGSYNKDYGLSVRCLQN